MILETNRLQIIPCTIETVQITINQNYYNGPHISSYLKDLTKDPSLLYWGCWIVVRKSDERVIGDIGFKGKPDEKQTVEVGYGFLEEFWNKGYATEAVEALIGWAFNTSKVEKVKAETLKDNYGSMSVLAKLGMQRINETETMINWELDKEFYQF
ncbi:GNAT family N-acetyltransferase [Lysinibacillus sp. SGAir0095]|uniref:GNAT family N-acetyltransferase n=1 Tax=Lysinibacillus sp. SGAir0095 TaxID=2070463 RepID=UPI0010CD461B|nr:GNAT family N-acetyltransferase [Lysinibacillus sp. SGAir0095]QCR31237.1 GNAT family N-acetyltransferase [Lysinibacillus sp. SGAir0095]